MSMSFVGLHRIPFAFYRSGTSRGLFLLEKDLPPLGSTRDAILCQLMGSGHPQQLGGFGGGTGPTSKVAVVGPHEEPGSVTYNFAQCEVEIANVDKSHGDCGNMLAAVAPFALERGVAMGTEFETSTKLKIHSLNTGACYEANVPTTISSGKRCVQYLGNLEVPGAPGCAAPISLASLGVAGTQTGKLLPTDCPVDTLDFGLGKAKATLLDFARALVIVDAADILPKLGYSDLGEISLETVHADASLCDALEAMRRQASLMMGMGDCTGKDAPKLALVGPDGEGAEKGLCTLGGSLTCRYFVNPGRAEMHPTIAMTAAQALGAACLLQGSVARNALGSGVQGFEPQPDDAETFSFAVKHPQGSFPEDGKWTFREILTVEVYPDEEVCISICCSQQVDLLVAALSLASKCVGEVCVPVASVLPQLVMEDRDLEGVVYATPQIGFDLLKDGVKTGRCYMSFETKHPPPRVAISETWCAFSN
ncbi:unnamed protein product [Durusdinium trenchii]|uniref:DUF453-domain-containing protein n=1 Tax=Durusdinium trenchii TaxID=1381693 RepID=A0ABP0HXM6_9DINO